MNLHLPETCLRWQAIAIVRRLVILPVHTLTGGREHPLNAVNEILPMPFRRVVSTVDSLENYGLMSLLLHGLAATHEQRVAIKGEC